MKPPDNSASLALAPEAADIRARSVLVADDEPVARRLLSAALTTSGYDVTAVADGESAWQVLSRPDRPALAILDWMMPGMTGIEVCQRLRETGTEPSTYLIVLTSREQTADLVTALRAGADDYITKPFQPEELRARVAVGVRISSLQQQLSDRVHALEDALAHVQQLQGMIPICAWCRQVRSDENFWERVESYLARRSGLQFSHGICPSCRVKVTAPAS
jgi:DNA-binding response OmpR family regulator